MSNPIDNKVENLEDSDKLVGRMFGKEAEQDDYVDPDWKPPVIGIPLGDKKADTNIETLEGARKFVETFYLETAKKPEVVATPPPYLSASILGAFEQCPSKFARSYFSRIKGNMDGAKWGIKFHNLMEEVTDAFDYDSVTEQLDDIFGEEADSVYDMIVDMRNRDSLEGTSILVSDGRLCKEYSFELYMDEADVTITGHIDEIRVSEDGKEIIIRDFKTTLKYEPDVVWCNRVQPRCYNWAVRKLFPGYEKYHFEIAYPRLNDFTRWQTHEESQSFTSYVRNLWQQMVAYFQAGWTEEQITEAYPEIFGTACDWCHFKQECKEYQRRSNIKELPVINDETIDEEYERLSVLLDAITNRIKDIKEAIMIKIESENQDKITIGTGVFRKSSRSVNYYPTKETIAILEGSPDINDDDLNELLTIKAGAMNNLLKEHPELRPMIEKIKRTTKGTPFVQYAGSTKPK